MKLTQVLFDSLRSEETRKAEILGRAMNTISNPQGDLTFAVDVLAQNKTIPFLVCNTKNEFQLSRNIDSVYIKDPVRIEELRLQFEQEY